MSKSDGKTMSAAEVAAAGAEVATVKWRDLELVVPKYDRWPVDALEALDDTRLYVFLREILGPEQWAAFKASDPQPVQADAIALSNLIGEAAAHVPTLGESQASAGS